MSGIVIIRAKFVVGTANAVEIDRREKRLLSFPAAGDVFLKRQYLI